MFLRNSANTRHVFNPYNTLGMLLLKIQNRASKHRAIEQEDHTRVAQHTCPHLSKRSRFVYVCKNQLCHVFDSILARVRAAPELAGKSVLVVRIILVVRSFHQ